jgi:MYXO-CTERM domain-containing protein
LTHELGHVLGLDHPCDDGTIVPTPTDHLGQTIPSCQPEWRLPTEIKESTMYNYSGLAEIKKRTLEPDDKAGVCAIYPASADPELCEPIRFHPQDCGCNQISASGDPVGLSLPFWLAALGLYVLTRRSRRKTTVVSR